MKYLGIRCRCKKKESQLECWSLLGGPSLDTLLNHDYESAPWVDVRFCPVCRKMMKITINSLNEIPSIEPVPKDRKLDFVRIEDVFQFVKVRR